MPIPASEDKATEQPEKSVPIGRRGFLKDVGGWLAGGVAGTAIVVEGTRLLKEERQANFFREVFENETRGLLDGMQEAARPEPHDQHSVLKNVITNYSHEWRRELDQTHALAADQRFAVSEKIRNRVRDMSSQLNRLNEFELNVQNFRPELVDDLRDMARGDVEDAILRIELFEALRQPAIGIDIEGVHRFTNTATARQFLQEALARVQRIRTEEPERQRVLRAFGANVHHRRLNLGAERTANFFARSLIDARIGQGGIAGAGLGNEPQPGLVEQALVQQINDLQKK